MARQYSTKTFLRRVPNSLLAEYFRRREIDLGIEWLGLAETDVDSIVEALQGLADGECGAVESDFSMINELACGAGVRAILEEGAFWGEDWGAAFEKMENDYARALWTYLNEPRRFEVAGAFHQMDRYGGWWRRFVGERLEPDTESDSLMALAAELREVYQRQGRGRHCHVDAYLRHDPERYCFFAYPEDIATSDLGYDDDGCFVRRPYRSAFELVFVYRPEGGVVEIHAEGVKKFKEALAEVFCRTVLGLTGLPEEGDRAPFDLSPLKDPKFPFHTDPIDGVLSVELKMLRLDLPLDRAKGGFRRIIISAEPLPASPQAVHLLLDEVLDRRNVLDEALISQAKLRFTFRPEDGRRQKTLTFDVTYPDRCALKDDRFDQIAKKYLKRWGIARD